MFDVDTPSNPDEPAVRSIDHRYRLLGTISIVAMVVIGAFLALMTTGADGSMGDSDLIDEFDSVGSQSSGVGPSRLVLSHLRLRDTVYTTDSVFLEVNLSKQNVTVHRRGSNTRTFLVSTGNPYIREGMATPSGVFTVQNMTPLALSKQFNNARLHNWIGVQGGVGFHGLDGSGYYGHLGVRPSSHGCLRMSREAIRAMYGMVHPGALIMVHNGDPARVVAFCEARDTVGAELIDSASVFNRELGKRRLEALMEGRAWIEPQPRLVHLGGQRLRWGMSMARSSSIPRQQLPDAFSLSGADELIAASTSDVTDRPILGRWRAEAESSVQSQTASKRTAWKAESEPDYGN